MDRMTLITDKCYGNLKGSLLIWRKNILHFFFVLKFQFFCLTWNEIEEIVSIEILLLESLIMITQLIVLYKKYTNNKRNEND